MLENYNRAILRPCTSGIFYTNVYLYPVTSSTLYDPLELVPTVDSLRVKINDLAQNFNQPEKKKEYLFAIFWKKTKQIKKKS